MIDWFAANIREMIRTVRNNGDEVEMFTVICNSHKQQGNGCKKCPTRLGCNKVAVFSSLWHRGKIMTTALCEYYLQAILASKSEAELDTLEKEIKRYQWP